LRQIWDGADEHTADVVVATNVRDDIDVEE